MPICRNPEVVRPLLLRDEPGTRSIYNLVFGVAGSKADWIRVDDLENPHAVIARQRGMYLHATSPTAATRLLSELPKRWHLTFAATQMRFVPAVRRVRKLNWVESCYYYILDPERLVIDRKHELGELGPQDIPLVTRHWPFGRSRRYVRWRIAAGPTCAVRSGGKLVAWALTHGDGSMGMLHVMEEFRGQGMARSITTAIAERCMQAGIKPFLYIVKGNQASISLTESMGFRRYGAYAWFGE